MSPTRSFLAALLSLIISCTAFADVLLHNLHSLNSIRSIVIGETSSGNNQAYAVSFTMPEAPYFLGKFSAPFIKSDTSVATPRISIHTDDNGSIGTEIAIFDRQSHTISSDPYPQYVTLWSTDIVPLAGNTTYWFLVKNGMSSDSFS